MKLSTKGKYGLYAMYYLAQHAGEGCQSLRSVAEIGVPEDYLEQLLGTLRRAGLVTTVRGAQGGYALAKAPEEVSNVSANSPEWFKNGVRAALLAPTAVNQQKFYFTLENGKVTAKAKTAFYSKVDLGIAKYHFELGAGRKI